MGALFPRRKKLALAIRKAAWTCILPTTLCIKGAQSDSDMGICRLRPRFEESVRCGRKVLRMRGFRVSICDASVTRPVISSLCLAGKTYHHILEVEGKRVAAEELVGDEARNMRS